MRAPALLGSATAMADVQPLRALHYDQSVVGPLADVVAPPYDVIDDEQRAALIARSPFNVVAVDLPRGEPDPYASARELFESWQLQGALVARPRAGGLGAHAGLHRPRRTDAHAAGVLLPCSHRGVRPRARSPARAHPPRPQGGQAAPHARHAREHLADLLALFGPLPRGLGRALAGHRAGAVGRGHRLRRHGPSPVARLGPGGDRGRAGRHRRRGAA